MNINKKLKKGKIRKSRLASFRVKGPTVRIRHSNSSLRSSNVNNEQWFLWNMSVVYYGGTFMDYLMLF